MNSIKKFDDDLPDREKENIEMPPSDVNNTTLQELGLGFGPEDDDEMQGMSSV